jgi:hypothetical protein
MKRHYAVLFLPFLTACASGGNVGSSSSSAAPGDAAAGNPAMASMPSLGTTGAQVVIAFYQDAACTPGTEVGQRRYDTAQPCFSWFAAGSNAQENSADHFQCFRDRLCYTQHPNSTTCEAGFATAKEARVGECVKEPAGRLYARVMSGTEACPPPPPGFDCPLSAPGAAR